MSCGLNRPWCETDRATTRRQTDFVVPAVVTNKPAIAIGAALPRWFRLRAERISLRFSLGCRLPAWPSCCQGTEANTRKLRLNEPKLQTTPSAPPQSSLNAPGSRRRRCRAAGRATTLALPRSRWLHAPSSAAPARRATAGAPHSCSPSGSLRAHWPFSRAAGSAAPTLTACRLIPPSAARASHD